MSFNNSDKTFEIYINSEYDKQSNSNDTTSNFTTFFQSIPLDSNKTYGLAASSIQIPNLAPQIHDNEKDFQIEDGAVTNLYTYDNNRIFNDIPALLSYVNSLVNIEGLVFSQDANTKCTLLKNGTGETIKLLINTESSKRFFRKLGFVLETDAVILNANNLLSSSYPSLISTSRYYVVCEEISNNSYAGFNQYNNWSIFKSINVNSGFGSYCNFESGTDLYFHDLKISGSINNLSFRVLNDQMETVDLKGVGVMMSLYIREL